MSRPLVRAQRIIEGRLRLLEQKLNNELGFRDQRLRFSKLAMRNGPTKWMLRNGNVETTGTVLPEGSVAELAPSSDDESILYFGYSEEWQPARGRDQIEFVSSNLRFVISGVEAMPDLRFRLEWAGMKNDGGAVEYPGVGAAHPHWQFDVDGGWIDPVPLTAERAKETIIEIDLERVMEEIDLRDELADAPAPKRVSATLAGFHRLHLPARTMWHELLCIMPDDATPQQHTPASEDEIDRWVISALRYLKHEFALYM
jgi:hypothetical protein